MSGAELTLTTGSELCGTGTTKRSTKAEMEFRRSQLIQLAQAAQPASVRHLYYRAVVLGLVDKRESGYRKVQREVLALRRAGLLPYHWIEDHARRAHHPDVDGSAGDALLYLARTYRQNPWGADGPTVEVWCESDSIAGVLMELRDKYAVPIYPIKGQSSETFAYEAARSYRAGAHVVVLYAGDYDPSGLQIAAQLEGKLRRFAADSVSIDFRVLAITAERALTETMQLLGTPAKQRHWVDADGVRREFIGQSIEAEALDPNGMRKLFTDAIEAVAREHYGLDIFAENREVERVQRARLADLAERWSW